MREIKITVNNDVVSYIERCQLEYETMRDNVAFMIENASDASILDTPVFRRYEEKQAQAKATYNMAKMELEARFMPEALKGHKTTWSLDFRTKVMTVTQLCDCEVAL